MASISLSPFVLPTEPSNKPLFPRKEQETVPSAVDKVAPKNIKQPSDALGLQTADGLELALPNFQVKQKLALSRLEKLPPEILDPIVQITLDAGLNPKVLASVSSKLLYTVCNLVFYRLKVILTSAENFAALPISVAQWLEAKKYNAWLNSIFKKANATDNIKKHITFKKSDINSFPDRLYFIGLHALKTGLVSWCEEEKGPENSGVSAQTASFEAVYKKKQIRLEAVEVNLQKVPEQIGFLQSLEFLDLSFNNLSEVPQPLYHLRNVKNLALNHNQITTITSNVKLLRNLKILNLAANRITELPFQIGELENLDWLNVSYNNIKHFIASAGQFPKLDMLLLEHNLLLETVSKERASLPYLQLLTVKDNLKLVIPSTDIWTYTIRQS